jgi:hypothetical protein
MEWPAGGSPKREIGTRRVQYLIGGEAFDWLVSPSACSMRWRTGGQRERDALLWENHWPLDIDDQEFAARLGRAKHSAHLNYLYGVLVEEALQLSVEEEIHKEGRSRAWGTDPRADETMYQRVYGKTRLSSSPVLRGDRGKARTEHRLRRMESFHVLAVQAPAQTTGQGEESPAIRAKGSRNSLAWSYRLANGATGRR